METPETARMDTIRPNPDGSQGALHQARPNPTLLRAFKVLADQVLQLSAELKQSRQEIEALECALITRIADVDDERRRGGLRIQRLLRSQRDELDANLRGQRILMAVLLLIISLLMGGSLVFMLFSLQSSRQALETQLNELKQAVTQISLNASTATDPQTRAQIERLSLTLAELASDLKLQSVHADQGPVPAQTATSESGPATDLALPAVETQAPDQQAPASATGSDHQEQTAWVPETSSAPDLASAETAPSPGPEERDEPGPTRESAPDTPISDGSVDSSLLRETAHPDTALAKPSAEQETTGSEPAEASDLQAPTPNPPEPVAEGSFVTTPKTSHDLTRRLAVGDRPLAIQLIGFTSLQALERFVADNPLPMVYYYRQETYQGRPWYVLIHSLHSNRESAEAAVAALPPQLGRLNLWVRQLRPETELIEVQRLAP